MGKFSLDGGQMAALVLQAAAQTAAGSRLCEVLFLDATNVAPVAG
jgi:hypothetical protein